jgi:hypothetical protein
MVDCPSCHTQVPDAEPRCSRCGASLAALASGSFAVTGGVRPGEADDENAMTVLPTTPRPSVSSPFLSSAAPGSDGAEFSPGALLAERYRIVALLGRGGMGEVYRADDLRLAQPVALKFLPRALGRDQPRLDRFLAEVRTARQVSHPNVCRMYDIGEIDGRHFLSMEYVDGEDLASLLRRIGRLPVDKAIEIARQLCAALGAAHDKGVLHRDLKPANVMLDGRGKVRLTDFGLAEPQGQSSGDFAGTPAYMAPEQFSGKPASVQSDLYALGLVLYEIFSGRRAFDAGTLAELRRLHEESHAEQLTSSVRDIDPTIERVIFRCLEKDPANRPASAIAVAAALPGGDPLAAALAAGETPSPEMVAAAGEAGIMRPAVAAAWLTGVLAAVFLAVMMATGGGALSKLPLNDSPDVSRFKAREMLARLGQRAPVVDSAFGYRWDAGYIDWVASHDQTAGRWRDLPKGHVLLRSWHRTSPVPMIPNLFLANRIVEGGNVRPDDPPRQTAGMTLLELDTVGRLVRFDGVPPQVETDPPAVVTAIDWAPIVKETGLDPASLAPAEPRWTPATYADQRAAWTGHYPDMPTLPVRVEAAALRGKPIALRVILPWTKAERDPVSRTTSAKATQILGIGTLLSVIVGAVVFARRNLLLGRGDRRGATRLAAFVSAVVAAVLLLEMHYVASTDLIVVLLRLACWALFAGAFSWTLYLALEPPIRRRWPRTLIAWNRLLTGRWTDPLVGRDVLVGAAAGTLMSLLAYGSDAWVTWAGGAPPAPGLGLAGPLSGVSISASWLLLLLYDQVFSGLALFFLVFLLRLVLRRDWLAATAWGMVSVAQNVLGSSTPWLTGVVAALVVTTLMVVLFRFGIVCFCTSTFYLAALTEFPVTADLTTWYGTGTVVVLGALVALTVFGFRTATAGKPLLGAAVD